ncbi:aminotransferase class IV [Microbacterium sp. LEMMJ01]|uniref:aminotransferase class IV n=1 Tax=Microbacterium sp. LEMMJ01 TaxID=1978350 RepID=UPI000A1E2C6E|nr:aminotransferase class IV [Microbacterium sp. LEMMJ01]OSO98255.1 4-amino-4-deoxychorismate lyase [Microbacterium sp. LEMMJ01]
MRALLLYRLDLAAEAAEDGIHAVDPREPIIRATDLGVTRGDGVFETAVVRGGRPQALEAHLVRMERSAQLLGLPAPGRERWARAVRRAAAEVSRPGVLRDGEIASIKFAMTRGDEIDPAGPTGWVLGFAGEDPEAVRARGVSAAVLDRGYRHDVMETAPWLLQGAKSLAYAVNQAALREARSRGADDVVFVSADGFVLEGPRSTLIARLDGALVTPPPEYGVLPGTTQADVFAGLAEVPSRVGPMMRDDLERADALWLCSSTRGAVPVRELDGVARAMDPVLTARMNTVLDGRED